MGNKGTTICITVDCRRYFYQDRGRPLGLCVVPLRFGPGSGILQKGTQKASSDVYQKGPDYADSRSVIYHDQDI